VALTREEVEKVAALAHLQLTEEELETFRRQLDSILAYVAKLSELETAQVEPMAQVLYQARENVAFREDKARASLPREGALAVAPETNGSLVKVPKVVER
jgi:aspartyl-tRNA(Asn)/glutamyl-tRNA(Gln) amidotransferase subunit C